MLKQHDRDVRPWSPRVEPRHLSACADRWHAGSPQPGSLSTSPHPPSSLYCPRLTSPHPSPPRPVQVRPGETALAFHTATNPTDRPIDGIATYNVVPFEAGAYFNKIQCFCFEEQRLNAKEQVRGRRCWRDVCSGREFRVLVSPWGERREGSVPILHVD